MTPTVIRNATLYNCDCMELMKTFTDKQFDLAIVDPPYGIGAENHAGKKENGWTQWEKKNGIKQFQQKNILMNYLE